MKICRLCGRKYRDYPRKICPRCRSDQQNERRWRIRQQLDEYKQTLACACCGFDDWRALEFHHQDPDKKEMNIGDGARRGWSFEHIMAEVAKCAVLCANCHAILHHSGMT